MDKHRANVFFAAYAYFRWLDDIVDSDVASIHHKTAMLKRQRALITDIYDHPESARAPSSLMPEEQFLFFVIQHDLVVGNRALQSPISDMLSSLEMDAIRRGRVVQSDILCQIQQHRTRAYADFVSNLLHQGHVAGEENRLYLFALACDEAHKLRDMMQDIAFGYFNISSEELQQYSIALDDVECPGFKAYVRDKVNSTRTSFMLARKDLRHVSLTLRTACSIYGLRHLVLLNVIENDDYCLRFNYVLAARDYLRSAIQLGR